MLKTNVKLAWRNLFRNPFFALLNIVGLSVGLAFALLIFSYVWSEFDVNARLRDLPHQYIIQSRWKNPNEGLELTSFGPLSKELKERYPNLVSNYYRWDGITSTLSKGDRIFREGLQVGDSTFLSMYGFHLLYGDPRTALVHPYSMILSKAKAQKYFGRSNVVGETLTVESFSGTKHDFAITGVLPELPKNSVTFINDDNNNQVFVSTADLPFFSRNMDWTSIHIPSYVELQPGVKPEQLTAPMEKLIQENAQPSLAHDVTPYLVPLKEYQLQAGAGVVRKVLYLLSVIAFFILLMAVVNFVNLAVSRSATRMKEIGIRKVAGGLRWQLVFQFLTESTLLVAVAMVAALVIYTIVKGYFGNMLRATLPALSDFPTYFILIPFTLVLVLGGLAGFYPALMLSSLKPVDSLKGSRSSVGERVRLRRLLVAFQFATAIIAFAGAIVISRQVHVFFQGDLGFNKDYVISVGVPRNWTPAGVKHMEVVGSELAVLPQVSDVSLSWDLPDGNQGGGFGVYPYSGDSTRAIAAESLTTDENFASTFKIPMEAGVFFAAPGVAADSSRVVINASMARALGFKNPADALNVQLKGVGSPTVFTVAGVTKDFHYDNMKTRIQPLVILNLKAFSIFRLFAIRLRPGNIGGSLAALQRKWATLLPGEAFEYKFLDESLARMYKTEVQLQQASYVATFLSFIIVLLGVLGLVSLSVARRTKEIGIRKVLGSPVASIVNLFLKEMLFLLALAGMVALPVAYLLMHHWLQDYAYRIDLNIFPFVIAILVLAFMTILLITASTIRTALSNPVKSLRTE